MITTYNQITQLDCEKDNECDSLCSCQTDEPLYDKKITDDQMNIEYTTECSECESVVSCCDEYIANNESTDDIIADHEDNNDDEQKNMNGEFGYFMKFFFQFLFSPFKKKVKA